MKIVTINLFLCSQSAIQWPACNTYMLMRNEDISLSYLFLERKAISHLLHICVAYFWLNVQRAKHACYVCSWFADGRLGCATILIRLSVGGPGRAMLFFYFFDCPFLDRWRWYISKLPASIIVIKCKRSRAVRKETDRRRKKNIHSLVDSYIYWFVCLSQPLFSSLAGFRNEKEIIFLMCHHRQLAAQAKNETMPSPFTRQAWCINVYN